MAQLRLEPPEQFDFRKPDDWPRWKRRFGQYRVASGLESSSELQQVSTLLYCIGEEAESVLISTDATADDRKEYKKTIAKFDEFFSVRRNVIYERARFNRRSQLQSETAEEYIVELYRLAETCNYGDLKDEMIRDRLVVGIRDVSLSQQLQIDAGLTLEKAKTKIRQREAVGEQQKELQGATKNAASLEEVGSQWRHKSDQPRRGFTNRSRTSGKERTRDFQSTKSCSRCGKEPHSRDKCPARDATCHRCTKKGHYGSQCRTKQMANVTTENVLGTAFLDTVAGKRSTAWHSTVKLNNQLTKFKLDTGAEVTAISRATYLCIKKPKLSIPEKTLYGPSRQPLNTLGQFQGKISYRGVDVMQNIYVVEGLKINLLGLPAITALNLAVRVDATESTTPTSTKTEIEKQFPSLFRGLGNIGDEYEIRIKPDAKPHSIYTPRHVPMPLRPKVQEELNRMESLGVISKIDEPTEWCAGMVVVPKKGGNIRICVDLKPLNTNVRREVHPLPKVDETLAQLSGARVFSKLDANSGFWQIPLAKKSRPLTTFLTPFGRYCFNKMPFGISSAPEHFQKRMTKILTGLPGVLCLMDDVLVFGSNTDEHDERLKAALNRIQSAGVTLNPEKCEFRKSQLKFLGHVVNQHGIQADPDKVSAILQMKPPTNITELRRFMGMVNQLGKFSPNYADLTQPIRPLLSKKSSWLWGPEQDRSFLAIKNELTKPTILTLYDPLAPMKVCADASSYGLGAVLLQKQNTMWKPVAYASRTLTDTEKRYAQIEKEALASTWACEKFSTYILGTDFTLETDHKPLVPLLGIKCLNDLPPRILRFRLRLARFDYTITHVPGKLLYTADALSRDPSTSGEKDHRLADEAEHIMELNVTNLPASTKTRALYQRAQAEDSTYSLVIDYCKNGWPNKAKLPQELQPLWNARSMLTVDTNNLLLYGNRIIVPESLREQTLQKIHSGHQGIQRCRLRAKTSVWWPGISKDIENMVRLCHTCAKNTPSRKQPMIMTQLPEYPWQKIATDLFQLKNTTYLIVVDYFSRFPEVKALSSTTSSSVINALKTMFARFGIPETLISDNGPQFSSLEFKEFSGVYEFNHVTSSPLYPQSNGQAERSVQTVKHLLKDSSDPHIALLTYRSTPFPWCGLSPAQLLMGRCIRSNIPLPKEEMIPKWKYLQDFRVENQKIKDKQKRDYCIICKKYPGKGDVE